MGLRARIDVVVSYFRKHGSDSILAAGAGLSLGGLVFCVLNFESRPVRDFALGMLPELVGLLFTVLVVERLVARQRKIEGERLALVPAKQLRILLTANLSTWCSAYRASLSDMPADPPKTPDALLECGDLCSTLANLDFDRFSMCHMTTDGRRLRWIDVLGDQQKTTLAALRNALDTYGAILRVEVLEALTSLLESPMWTLINLHAVPYHAAIRVTGKHENFAYLSAASGGVPGMLNDFFQKTRVLLILCPPQPLPSDQHDWTPAWHAGSNPPIASGRVTDPTATQRRKPDPHVQLPEWLRSQTPS